MCFYETLITRFHDHIKTFFIVRHLGRDLTSLANGSKSPRSRIDNVVNPGEGKGDGMYMYVKGIVHKFITINFINSHNFKPLEPRGALFVTKYQKPLSQVVLYISLTDIF